MHAATDVAIERDIGWATTIEERLIHAAERPLIDCALSEAKMNKEEGEPAVDRCGSEALLPGQTGISWKAFTKPVKKVKTDSPGCVSG